MSRIIFIALLLLSHAALAGQCIVNNDFIQCREVAGSVAAQKIFMAGGSGVGVSDTDSNTPPSRQPHGTGGGTTVSNDRLKHHQSKSKRTAANAQAASQSPSTM